MRPYVTVIGFVNCQSGNHKALTAITSIRILFSPLSLECNADVGIIAPNYNHSR